MLRDQYEPDKLFLDIVLRAGEMEPELVQIDRLLEDDELYQMLRADLAQRYPHTRETGQPDLAPVLSGLLPCRTR